MAKISKLGLDILDAFQKYRLSKGQTVYGAQADLCRVLEVKHMNAFNYLQTGRFPIWSFEILMESEAIKKYGDGRISLERLLESHAERKIPKWNRVNGKWVKGELELSSDH